MEAGAAKAEPVEAAEAKKAEPMETTEAKKVEPVEVAEAKKAEAKRGKADPLIKRTRTGMKT